MYYYYCVFSENGDAFQGIVYAENYCHAADMLTNFYDENISKMQIECACKDFVFEMEEGVDDDDLPL